jgi:diadenylate cyclase
MSMVLSLAQRCLGYIQTIQITDLLDIAILAYILYRLLLWARDSNAGQVLKGIALIFIMLWATSVFHLYVLNFLLSRVLELGFLAIVVVFQPEIRHFLEQFGAKGMPGLLARQESDPDTTERAIDELVAAYADLSRNRVGALTVFERSSILDDNIRTGTALDAEVSSQLLKNIFYPKAPLHDGAVIVRSGRIIGAGCIMPLSSNPSISRDLGTRHRAGIGTTEHSDAVVAIVSEETGSISVAVGGMLKRHLAPETLRRLLRKELLPEDSDPNGENGNSKMLETLSRLANLRIEDLLRPGKGENKHVE